ncbi:hypothetical protein C0J52_05268 [Blattella germanica]|nr:hypothetical protein C0J52_05268 [Blattella germanica]
MFGPPLSHFFFPLHSAAATVKRFTGCLKKTQGSPIENFNGTIGIKPRPFGL